MNICFVGNFYKTHLYLEISKELKRRNPKNEIYWILIDRNQINTIKNSNYILIDFSIIDSQNKDISNFKINDLVYNDRFLKFDKENGRNYLQSIQKPIYDFVDKNKISYIFGERTWAHELLIGRIVKKYSSLNCTYLSISTIRIPFDRFAFFSDEKETEILELKKLDDIQNFEIKKPDYLDINEKIIKKSSSLSGRVNRIKRFLTSENISKYNPCNLSGIRHRFLLGAQEEFNRFMYRFIRTESFSVLKEKPFVFYGLHKQPESSIDVRGRYFEDQLQNIINIWRNLPDDWYLVVKERSNAIGDRSISFYKKIKALPNVILIDHKTDSYSIMKNSKLVISVTGTICYEAALQNIPAITLSKTFFNKINLCVHKNWYDMDNVESLKEIIDNLPFNNLEDFKKYILSYSYLGNVTDPNSAPEVLNHGNISNIADAFEQLS